MKNLDADYPLQGSSLDLPLSEVLSYSEKDRAKYISKFLIALGKKIDANEMALKKKISMQTEMRDLRRLVRSPFDRYLLTEDKTRKRNILGFGSYGSTHTEYSRKLMWRMATKKGNLSSLIQNRDPKLALEIDKILDIRITNKNMLWHHGARLSFNFSHVVR